MKPIRATTAPAAGGWTLTRARFAMASDAFNPGIGATYVLPFSTTACNDGGVTLNDDGTLTVATAGLYRVSISGVWQDRADGQVDLRIVGFGHGRGGEKPGVYVPGQLTKITAHFDRLVQHDVAASNTTRKSRWQGAWKPGVIALGQVASIDVPVAPAGVVAIGDLAFASHRGFAGDVVHAVFSSKTAGDFLQASDSTFLPVARWA